MRKLIRKYHSWIAWSRLSEIEQKTFRDVFGPRQVGQVDFEPGSSEDDKGGSKGGVEHMTVLIDNDTDVVVSKVVSDRGNMHMPVLDLDYGANLLESGTPGHHHLYLDKELEWEDYILVLSTLAAVGLIEDGFAQASIRRGYTAVRVPWKPKRQT